jgi:hypothetical protein
MTARSEAATVAEKKEVVVAVTAKLCPSLGYRRPRGHLLLVRLLLLLLLDLLLHVRVLLPFLGRNTFSRGCLVG